MPRGLADDPDTVDAWIDLADQHIVQLDATLTTLDLGSIDPLRASREERRDAVKVVGRSGLWHQLTTDLYSKIT